MPLPSVAEVKQFIKVDPTITVDDGMIAGLIVAARAIMERRRGTPYTATPYTSIDRTTDAQPTATFSPPTALICQRYPLIPSTFVAAGYNGSIVDPTTYTVNGINGIVRAVVGVYFGIGPYTLTYTAGMDAHPDFDLDIDPIVGVVIKDICAVLYDDNRNALRQRVSAGGGTGVDWNQNCSLPRRTEMLLATLPGAGFSLGV